MVLISHSIIHNPQPEEAGTITVNAVVYDSQTFSSSTFVNYYIDEESDDTFLCKEDMNYFLMESGINDDDITDAMLKLDLYVCDVTSSPSFTNSPDCALKVSLHVQPNPQIDEGIQVSFEEANIIQFKPASKLVVKSLTRNVFEKIRATDEKCVICLGEFNNGGRVLTLPCQHTFDEECVVKWFETSHFCPLCRFELPCEDQ